MQQSFVPSLYTLPSSLLYTQQATELQGSIASAPPPTHTSLSLPLTPPHTSLSPASIFSSFFSFSTSFWRTSWSSSKIFLHNKTTLHAGRDDYSSPQTLTSVIPVCRDVVIPSFLLDTLFYSSIPSLSSNVAKGSTDRQTESGVHTQRGTLNTHLLFVSALSQQLFLSDPLFLDAVISSQQITGVA